MAGALALTARTPMCCDADQRPAIEIRTDAYSLAEFDVLNVVRQFSALRGNPGAPMTLSRVRSLPAPITYRRVP
ncbi:hypothetical protein D3C83_25020 [compost metagenome]